MKRFIQWVVGVVAVLAIIFIAGAYVLPGEAALDRHITINAPPEKVFAIVGDLRRFHEYSPWAEMDPDSKYSFSGPEKAVGQQMSWQSAKLGSGSQTITDYVENRRIAADLDFGEMGKAKASIDLSPAAAGTHVIWGFRAPLGNPLERWMGLLYDKWIGADYEKGLIKLKALAEKEAASP